MPAGFLGNTGDDVTVFALADHQGGVIGSIGLEVADGCEEHLVPAAQENPAAILQIFQPGLLVFDVKAEGPAVGADDVIEKAQSISPSAIFIMLTAYTDEKTENRLRKMGIKHIIYKPIEDIETLVSLIRRISSKL